MLSYISMANPAAPAAPVSADATLLETVLADAVLADAGAGAPGRCGGPTWLSRVALPAGLGTSPAGLQASGEVALCGGGAHAGGLVEFARLQRTTMKNPPLTQMYARPTTRIAMTSGGARGPHPARDPV